MKQSFKRLGGFAVAVILVCALALCFTACDKPQFSPTNSVIVEITDYNSTSNAVDCTIKKGESSFSATATASNLHALLCALKEQGKITYAYSDGAYGAYVSNVCDLDVSAQNSFVAFYHNLSDSSLIYYGVDAIDFNGTTFRSANVGVESLPLSQSAKFLITVSTY